MPVRFQGFKAGSNVALRVQQGADSVESSNPSWGATATVSVEIDRSNLQVAPEAFQFRAVDFEGFDAPPPSGPNDPSWREFHMVWSFGDSGATFDRPTQLLDEHRDANTAYGPLAAHVFSRPGLYRVTLTVFEMSSGKTGFWTDTFEVKDPDVEFAGICTIYVDDEGIFANAPSGAQLYTSINSAFFDSRLADEPRRIMLRSGRTFSVESGFPNIDWEAVNFYLCSEKGPAFPAEIDCRQANHPILLRDVPGTQTDAIVSGVNMTGSWESTVESSDGKPVPFMFWSRTDPVDYILLHDCTFSGFKIGLYLDSGVRMSTVHSTRMSDWQEYCVFGPSQNVNILGCEFSQAPEALNGGNRNGNPYNSQGPIRLSESTNVVIEASDCYSRTGWFVNIWPYRTVQPCMRLAVENSTLPNNISVQRCTLEGGFSICDVSYNGGSAGLVLIEKNVFVGSFMTGSFMNVFASAISVRNNVFVRPSVPNVPNFVDLQWFLAVGSQGAQHSAAPHYIGHNTFVSRLPFDTGSGQDFETNNLTDVRGLDTNIFDIGDAGRDEYQPLDTTPLITPRETGYIQRWEEYSGTLSSDVPNGSSFDVTYSEGDASWFEDNGDSRVDVAGEEQNVSIAFGPSSATITNTSGGTWASGAGHSAWLLRDGRHALPKMTEFATPPDEIASFAPLIGSSALGAVEEPLVRDDILGNIRPPYASKGAFEAPQ